MCFLLFIPPGLFSSLPAEKFLAQSGSAFRITALFSVRLYPPDAISQGAAVNARPKNAEAESTDEGTRKMEGVHFALSAD
jgi:hypothetical protein